MVGNIKHLFLHGEVKAIGDAPTGEFSGDLSTYGNVDLVGDVCEKGCFDDTVRDDGPKFPLLWHHSMPDVRGSLVVKDVKNSLFVEGSCNMEVQDGRDAFSYLKRGDVKGLSIGFIPQNWFFDEDGVRHLTKVKLLEGSIVTIPANPLAMASAKNLGSLMPAAVRKSIARASCFKQLTEEQRAEILNAVDAAVEEILDEIPDGSDDDKGKKSKKTENEDEAITEEEADDLKAACVENTKALSELRRELKA